MFDCKKKSIMEWISSAFKNVPTFIYFRSTSKDIRTRHNPHMTLHVPMVIQTFGREPYLKLPKGASLEI